MVDELKIRGGKKLRGKVKIQGSKNLAVSLIPACLLSRDVVVLHHVPPIGDVQLLIKILHHLHVQTTYEKETLTIDARNIEYRDLIIPPVGKFRASYYFMGVLVGMFHHLKILEPGGCRFGVRPIDYHLHAFGQCGVSYQEEDVFSFSLQKAQDAHIVFERSSVGATVNTALLAVQLPTQTILENAAIEPEVTELLSFLVSMGAKIEGIGTRRIIIEGGKGLHGTEYTLIPDRIEAGTYAIIGASLGDPLEITPVYQEHLLSLFHLFDVLKVPYHFEGRTLYISHGGEAIGILVETAPYPGFPTDLQQPLTAFLARIPATSIIIENIYSQRFAHIHELNKMGADISQVNEMMIIHGNQHLVGAHVDGKDLRGGAALVIAALFAQGESVVTGLRYINRGYEQIIKKVRALGADIQKIKEERK